MLDPQYRLSSAHKPRDLRSTAKAGLNGGYSVRRFVIADLKRMAVAARHAGARFSVQSAYRSYASQKVDVRALGPPARIRQGPQGECPRRPQ